MKPAKIKFIPLDNTKSHRPLYNLPMPEQADLLGPYLEPNATIFIPCKRGDETGAYMLKKDGALHKKLLEAFGGKLPYKIEIKETPWNTFLRCCRTKLRRMAMFNN